ncbi:MAG: phosphoribosyltransferase family protein [Elusimicrobiota bacterium]
MFRDRFDAGEKLARELRRYRGASETLVLGVPRGGVLIGGVLARELNLKLDVMLTKKIGHPHDLEVAIGAVSLTGEILDTAQIETEKISTDYVSSEISRIRASLQSRYKKYRAGCSVAPVAGKTVILTDDGAATGRTLCAGINLLRRQGARAIVVALPVASRPALRLLKACADEVVCLDVPYDFQSIGQYYRDFRQISDEEARALLKESGSVIDRNR